MKQLLVLRPCKANNRYRFGLYNADYQRLVQGKQIESLKVDLGDGFIDLKRSRIIYLNHGSLSNPSIASWLRKNKMEDSRNLFLFELEIKGAEHSFRLLGGEHDIVKLFVEHW